MSTKHLQLYSQYTLYCHQHLSPNQYHHSQNRKKNNTGNLYICMISCERAVNYTFTLFLMVSNKWSQNELPPVFTAEHLPLRWALSRMAPSEGFPWQYHRRAKILMTSPHAQLTLQPVVRPAPTGT